MKISELIARLEELKAEQGDLDVFSGYSGIALFSLDVCPAYVEAEVWPVKGRLNARLPDEEAANAKVLFV